MQEKITPMMQQWHHCKSKAKEALLLFRLGDFYEAFYDDARLLSEAAEVTLTRRGDVPMSGIPAHTLENYLEKLMIKGHLVAIAEQVEEAQQGKGIVKREIARLVSPGAVYTPSLLSEKKNNFFCCIGILNNFYSLSSVDLTTSECKVVEADHFDDITSELYKLFPTEVLLSEKLIKKHPELQLDLEKNLKARITIKAEWKFEHQYAHEFLKLHFNVHNLDGFGLKGQTCCINTLGALLSHIEEDLCLSIKHISSCQKYDLKNVLKIDPTTCSHLDILKTQSGNETGSLLSHLDRTKTPMGARLFKQWLLNPLLDPVLINDRLDATSELIDYLCTYEISESLGKIKDIQRLILRVATHHNNPRDIGALKNSLKIIPDLKKAIKGLTHSIFKKIDHSILSFDSLCDEIDKTLMDELPIKIHDGILIKEGVCNELDELKNLKNHSEEFLIKYQEQLKEETGIKTLKISYSKAFGYLIDVSRGQSSKVPSYFHKRQTLVNNERFITHELQIFEQKITTAEEKIQKLEHKIYHELKARVIAHSQQIQIAAENIAALDCFISLYHLSRLSGYVKPTINNSYDIVIEKGRHPILDYQLSDGSFVPNDTLLNLTDQKLALITGPNMAGKSTYIRQTAILTLMAQVGCYIPAQKATFGIVDKIFSRIGASDDLSRGQSTFMVEMTETANILRHASERSLVILDEIGRGTSTYDGIAIASAVAEYLLTHPTRSCKTLFATHYFELTELEEKFQGAVNYKVLVKEDDEGICLLRKIVRGSADKSYGIHVAKLAGIPYEVLSRANEILKSLETKSSKNSTKKNLFKKENDQLVLFQESYKSSSYEKIIDELKKLDILQTTPLAALNFLEQLVKKL